MDDKKEGEEESPRDSEANPSNTKLTRPVSGKSGGSTVSKKSMTDAVSQLTAKALREFRLDDEGTDLVEALADANEGPESETLLGDEEEDELEDDNGLEDKNEVEFDENEVEFDENVDVINDGEFSDEDDYDGDNDLVVLDPDHVSSKNQVV